MLIDPQANDYGYYPRVMIRLATIAYLSLRDIPGAVRDLKWRVVWGPAEALHEDVAYAAMFVCVREETNEYAVVIRGTNLMSWYAWESEDFDVATSKPFTLLAPHADAKAMISEGTYNGMVDLLGLTDPTTGSGVVEYLRAANPPQLYVTGHSLGGTLTPTMFACLNDLLYGGGFVHNMALWSFAGLTPGDAAFKDYFTGLLNPDFPWRLYNTLDIAPLCWWSLEGIRDIYAPNSLGWGPPEDAMIERLFAEAKGKNYTQPGGDTPLAGTFSYNDFDSWFWVLQAVYQHHTSTYQQLVDKAYPSARELERAAATDG